jgi:tetratricopeptide (TPR) repeat protein
VVSGAPGAGKTSLATRFAHRVATWFADGAIYLSLQDTDPGTLAAQLVRALGVPDVSLPPDPADRVALYRSLAVDRTLLVVLDNAADEQQVRSLIAPGPDSFTIITSRSRLGGLGSVHRLHLDVPDAESALQLLARIVGDDRVRREPRAASELIAQCGRLPLAIRVAGNRIDSWPDWSLQHLNDRLRDERERLRWLRCGDLDVHSAFTVSYDGLRPQAARLFRRLVLAPGPDFDAEAATVLMGADATAVLDELSDACLIETVYAAGRYRFHDLLRLFALERVDADEPAGDRETTQEAILRWLLTRASAASLVIAQGGAAGAELALDEALSWLDSHWPHVLAAAELAGRAGLDELVCAAVHDLLWYGDLRCAWPDMLAVSEWSVAAGRALGGGEPLAAALNGKGLALHGLGRFTDAIDVHRQALDVALAAGSTGEEAVAADRIGLAYVGLDQPEFAVDFHRRDVELCLLDDDLQAQASAYSHLGQALGLVGRTDEAIACYERALELQNRLDNKRGAAMAVNWLGQLHSDQDRFEQAQTEHESALAVFAEAGDVWGCAAARYGLGRAYRGLGQNDLAGKEFALAAEMFEAVADARWVRLARTALEQP